MYRGDRSSVKLRGNTKLETEDKDDGRSLLRDENFLRTIIYSDLLKELNSGQLIGLTVDFLGKTVHYIVLVSPLWSPVYRVPRSIERRIVSIETDSLTKTSK